MKTPLLTFIAAALFACLALAADSSTNEGGTGFAGAYKPSKNWQPPRDPAAIEKLHRFQDLKFGIMYCWRANSQAPTGRWTSSGSTEGK